MSTIEKIGVWGDKHHPKWMDIVRVILGLFLIYKGIDFLMNMSTVNELLASTLSFESFALMFVGHFVVFAHILGGILLVLGVLTRFACLIQIPILIVAVIFINAKSDAWRPYSELAISIIVLLLLIYFLVIGNGPWSVKVESEKENQ